jgi:FKBP-type peptidyl-prolyl cis-trans isomerase
MGGMQATQSGVQYEVYKGAKSSDTAIKSGDVITMDSRFTLQHKSGKDSVLSDTRKMGQPQKLMLDKRMRTQDFVDKALYDVVLNMHKGDSATFMVPVDSLDKKSLATVPFLKAGDNIKVDLTILDVIDSVKFQQQLNEMKVKQKAQFEQQKPMIIEQTNKYFAEVKAKHKDEWKNDSAAIKDYIKKANLTNVQSLPSGLFYVIDNPGTGKAINYFDTVAVNYKGYLLNGEVFDQSKQPFTFIDGAQQVIPGWDQGITLFHQGGKGKLIIPSYLGYGDRESNGIPANSVLVFDIEVVNVK